MISLHCKESHLLRSRCGQTGSEPQTEVFQAFSPMSSLFAPSNKPTSYHHMMESSVTQLEKSLLEAISSKSIH